MEVNSQFARTCFFIQIDILTGTWWFDWLDIVASIPHLYAHGQLFLTGALLRHLFGDKNPLSGICVPRWNMISPGTSIRGGFKLIITYVYPKAWLGPTGAKSCDSDQGRYQMTNAQSCTWSWYY
jgi:hypothetical protein